MILNSILPHSEELFVISGREADFKVGEFGHIIRDIELKLGMLTQFITHMDENLNCSKYIATPLSK